MTLHESAPYWLNLGLALGLSHPVLNNIDTGKHRGDNVSCLREMLAKLLSTQHVTWSLLSDALKKPTVKLIYLADSIMGNYHFQCLCSLLYLSFLVLDINMKMYINFCDAFFLHATCSMDSTSPQPTSMM